MEFKGETLEKQLFSYQKMTQSTVCFTAQVVHICVDHSFVVDSFLQKLFDLLILLLVEDRFSLYNETIHCLKKVLLRIDIKSLWQSHRIVVILAT